MSGAPIENATDPDLIEVWTNIHQIRNMLTEIARIEIIGDKLSTYTWLLFGEARGVLSGLRQSIGRDIDDAKAAAAKAAARRSEQGGN